MISIGSRVRNSGSCEYAMAARITGKRREDVLVCSLHPDLSQAPSPQIDLSLRLFPASPISSISLHWLAVRIGPWVKSVDIYRFWLILFFRANSKPSQPSSISTTQFHLGSDWFRYESAIRIDWILIPWSKLHTTPNWHQIEALAVVTPSPLLIAPTPLLSLLLFFFLLLCVALHCRWHYCCYHR